MKKDYPSKGDRGESGLVSGQMVGKEHVNFEAVGTLDELNCMLGWVKCVCDDEELKTRLSWVQGVLLDLGSYITGWSATEFSDQPVNRLEEEIHDWQQRVPELKNFLLPDGTELATRLHVARAVCRRAERKVARLIAETPRKVSENAPRFMNRLGDWLYMAARWSNVRAGFKETPWTPKKV